MYEQTAIEHAGLKIRIIQDENGEEPDWGDDEVYLSCSTRNHSFGRPTEEHPENFLEWGQGEWGAYGEEVPAAPGPGDEPSDAYTSYEVWLVVHEDAYEVWPFKCGNVHGPGSFRIRVMDLEDTRRRDPDGWIYVKRCTSPLEQLANPSYDPERVRDQLVEAYEQWANGDVWGFVLETEDGEELDSCWGYYGSESAIGEGKAIAEDWAKQQRPVVLLVQEGEGSGWKERTYTVPVAVGLTQVAQWVMTTQVEPDSPITGVTLLGAVAKPPERAPTEQLSMMGGAQ